MTQIVKLTSVSGDQGVKVFVISRTIGLDKVVETHDLPNAGDSIDLTLFQGRYLTVVEYAKSSIPPNPPPVPA